MGKKNGNKKGNNVRNVDPNFNALATGFTNPGPSTNETERESSDSLSQSFADGNPHGPSNQASNHQSSATRAHNSESTRIPDDPAIGGSESSVESGDSHSTSSAMNRPTHSADPPTLEIEVQQRPVKLSRFHPTSKPCLRSRPLQEFSRQTAR